MAFMWMEAGREQWTVDSSPYNGREGGCRKVLTVVLNSPRPGDNFHVARRRQGTSALALSAGWKFDFPGEELTSDQSEATSGRPTSVVIVQAGHPEQLLRPSHHYPHLDTRSFSFSTASPGIARPYQTYLIRPRLRRTSKLKPPSAPRAFRPHRVVHLQDGVVFHSGYAAPIVRPPTRNRIYSHISKNSC